jgi:fumarate hydratase class II
MPPTNRVEHDSMGALEVPANALWGAQTRRAVQNLPGTGLRMPRGALTEGGVHGAGSAA